jgi:putative transposase
MAETRLSRAAELVEMAVEETLAYYAFPEEHWRRIRTNNPLERILREIRRRTRVVGALVCEHERVWRVPNSRAAPSIAASWAARPSTLANCWQNKCAEAILRHDL